MKNLTDNELLLRFHGEPFSSKLCDELLSRLARVQELEARLSASEKELEIRTASCNEAQKEVEQLKQETYPGYKREKKIRCQLEKEVELKTLEIKILNQQINGLIRGLKKNIAEYKDGIYE